jgi:hypothetical protein
MRQIVSTIVLTAILLLSACTRATPPVAQKARLATQEAAPLTPFTPQSKVPPWPTPTPRPTPTPTPYCRPDDASTSLSASATTLEEGQVVSVTIKFANGDSSGVRLGQIRYSLGVQPPNIFTSNNLGPVEHPGSLEPGQSDETEFILRAAMPGRATLTGSTSFEIHPMDYSWGSWSGCHSGPLEIVVTPNTDKVINVYDDLYVRDGYSYPAITIAVASEDVWVGFGQAGGGVWRYDGEEWEAFTQAEGLPISDNVQVLRVAPNGSVWAGAGCQLARFADGVWEKMADCKELRGKVMDIVFTPDGATWVASALELSRFDGQTWTFYGKLAHYLAVGPDGTLWIVGWKGRQDSQYVSSFDGTDWMMYNKADLLGHGVGRIAVTPDGDVWGTTGKHGGIRYDGQTWRRTTYMEGLPSNEIRELVVGPDGVLWATWNEGLATFDGHRWAAHKAGLGGSTLALGPDGTIWLGTANGVVHLRP